MILTARQKEANALLQTAATHILLEGGSRSGKTALFVRALCHRAIKAPRSRHAALRYRFNHAKQSIGMDTLPKVMASCFPTVKYQLDKSDWYAKFPNASEIWIGGLDDKERTEKILGKEFATIFLNECSQISFESRNLALTRLAQHCPYKLDGKQYELALKMYYDLNPPSKAHWSYQLFHMHRDPDSKRQLLDPSNYASMLINPRDNLANLPAEYIKQLESLPARLQRRFLLGQYAEIAPGQLWTDEILDKYRVMEGELPDMQRVAVSVDPSGSGDEDNASNDAIGIMVGGLGVDGNGYLLEDLTCKAGPSTWGSIATRAFDRHDADVIVGEKNFGGEMVGYVLDTQPRTGRKRPFRLVTASRGKAVRAEPISVLHEQGKIRLVGNFNELEEELCGFTDHGYMGGSSPNRADAFVWLFTELFPGIVRQEQKEARKPTYEPVYHGAGGWMA